MKHLVGDRIAIGRLIASLALGAFMAFLVQIEPISLRDVFIHSRVFTAPELGVMEAAIGFVHSLVVTGACLIIIKRPIIPVAAAALIAQLIWIEWAYGFRQGGDTSTEAVLRYTEHIGVLLGAGAAAFAYARFFIRPPASSGAA